ncbi:unnamed protein product [Meloidogyne enterolobii]|uniref:Uncharacterized protein n=1 Tax=Meloidogyne enterolobii TaxID=390850 RepID=A0ACB1ALN4_MELEN
MVVYFIEKNYFYLRIFSIFFSVISFSVLQCFSLNVAKTLINFITVFSRLLPLGNYFLTLGMGN